eukprot:11253878-Alexandrium_andersonii.AAC.1
MMHACLGAAAPCSQAVEASARAWRCAGKRMCAVSCDLAFGCCSLIPAPTPHPSGGCFDGQRPAHSS